MVVVKIAIKYISQKEKDENLMKWVGFWRANPHRFVEDYLGIKLFLFQKILIYMMNVNPYFMYIAARGQIGLAIQQYMVVIGEYR